MHALACVPFLKRTRQRIINHAKEYNSTRAVVVKLEYALLLVVTLTANFKPPWNNERVGPLTHEFSELKQGRKRTLTITTTPLRPHRPKGTLYCRDLTSRDDVFSCGRGKRRLRAAADLSAKSLEQLCAPFALGGRHLGQSCFFLKKSSDQELPRDARTPTEKAKEVLDGVPCSLPLVLSSLSFHPFVFGERSMCVKIESVVPSLLLFVSNVSVDVC